MRFHSVVIAFIAAAFTTNATAQADPAPDAAPSLTSVNWRSECTRGAPCQLVSAIRFGDTVISRLSVYPVNNAEVIEFLTPLGVNLNKGVTLSVDGKRLYKTRYTTCNARGCLGFIALDRNLQYKLRRGNKLTVSFYKLNEPAPFQMAYPLASFADQYDAYRSRVGF